MEQQQIHEKRLTYLFLWLGILVVFALLIASYLSYRRPGISQLEKAQQQAQRAERVFATAGITGTANPDLTIIEFGDFACPFCKDLHPVVDEILSERSNLQLVWIHRINREHADSEGAAIAAECARQQGAFWEYSAYLFENQTDLSTILYNQIAEKLALNQSRFQECLGSDKAKSTVQEHNLFAQENEITSTPTLVIGTENLEGIFTKEDILSAIDRQI